MNIFAFIFARGGSVGLPGKNIKLLDNIPLLAHSINIAKKLNEVTKIYVSTDSKEIAEVGEKYGAEIIFRPKELATSEASEWAAWQHAIQAINLKFDIFLSLPTTSPLRHEQDVRQCINDLDENTDIVITVTPSARSPFFNMVTRENDGQSKLVFNKGLIRRQDAPQTFDITTVAYVSRPEFILNNSGIFNGRVKSVIVPKERAIDIDDIWDFSIAEIFHQRMKHESK